MKGCCSLALQGRYNNGFSSGIPNLVANLTGTKH